MLLIMRFAKPCRLQPATPRPVCHASAPLVNLSDMSQSNTPQVDLTRYVERHVFAVDDALDAAVLNDAVYRSTPHQSESEESQAATVRDCFRQGRMVADSGHRALEDGEADVELGGEVGSRRKRELLLRERDLGFAAFSMARTMPPTVR